MFMAYSCGPRDRAVAFSKRIQHLLVGTFVTSATLASRLCAEAFGTACLVFAGTGAVVVNDMTGGGVTHVGVALTFGLIVMVLVYGLGAVSGAHLNPAVTIGLCAAGRFSRSLVLSYVGSQCLGAIGASLMLRLLFPESATLGATIPAGSAFQSFVLEAILTLLLMVVVLRMAEASPAEKPFAGLVIGAVIGLEALFAGPISGASMNPARSLAPALVSMHVGSLWIYLVAPIVGALAGVPLARLMRASAGPESDAQGECR